MCALRLAVLILVAQCLHASRVNITKKVKREVPIDAPEQNEPQEPEMEEWEKELCVVFEGGILREVPKAAAGTSLDAVKCHQAIAVEDAHCRGLEAKKIGKLTHADFNSRCKGFRKNKAKVEQEVKERVPSGTIKIAVDACEPEVLDVCVKNTCPIMCFLKKRKDCNCQQICDETKYSMWNTRSMDCEDKKFSECQSDLMTALEGDGRHPELEALMREHTLKCVCVSWRTSDTRDICYQGGKGIKTGTSWCEFTDTPSWTKMLTQKSAENDIDLSTLPKPECTEFPGPYMGEGTLRMVDCSRVCRLRSWAAPNSPVSFGIVAMLLWLAVISFER